MKNFKLPKIESPLYDISLTHRFLTPHKDTKYLTIVQLRACFLLFV